MLGALRKQSNEKPCGTIDTLIGTEVEFRGNIDFSGGLRIDGKVKGNITARDAANSMLILGEHAEVRGKITAPQIIVNGTINGDVHCTARIELQSKARITGDVYYKLMGIAFGAAIAGNLFHYDTEVGKKGVVTQFKPVTKSGDTNS